MHSDTDTPGCDPWSMHMRRGDFAAAWRVSDDVLRRRLEDAVDCSSWPRHLQFIWRGEPVDGKRVLVRCYHGLGDTLQFVRLLAPLRERAREVQLWAQPALLPLLRSVTGIDRLLPLHDGAPDPDYDVDLELMEIPHVLRLTPELIPRRVPYVHVPPRPSHRVARKASVTGRAASLRSRATHTAQNIAGNDDALRVGLVWRSGSWVPERSIPQRCVARLAAAPAVRWYSLQYPPQELPLGAVEWSCEDIAEMAARVRSLDLLISVDTMAAHLAGAIAAPVWTLLHTGCDWRWMSGRSDTPWYPTMRLIRQRADADWDGVIDEVLRELRSTPIRARCSRNAATGYDSSARYSLSRL